ncbi:cell division ATP-binding protein FtsE [Clavibacter michiganensis]|uniref:cell division ATP-binding protein FtsE n=1 Tax=Clavibacter michiganensis TaxID=28447 RepID=UPI000D548468|nr:cell division ATP-binding protein FtsE [Clavibacter michiganensis subsp. insidiosus]
MIRFDHVSKVYPGNPRPALSSVDLEILRGEFVFLVGASGSGKSSFLRLVLKEDRPTQGTIHVLGQQLNQLSSRKVPYYRRSLGVVFQDFRLLPNKSVFDNVAFTLQVIGKSRGFIQEAVPDVLAMVGLQGKEQRLPHELSGGEQQRVAIARAVVNKPAVLLADEPTGNLDPLTSAGIMQVLERINANGTTVIMATHDSGIVDQMQKRVIELIGGEVVRDEVGGQYQTSAIDLPRTAENPVGVNPEHPPVAAPTPVFVPAAPLPAPTRPTAPRSPPPAPSVASRRSATSSGEPTRRRAPRRRRPARPLPPRPRRRRRGSPRRTRRLLPHPRRPPLRALLRRSCPRPRPPPTPSPTARQSPPVRPRRTAAPGPTADPARTPRPTPRRRSPRPRAWIPSPSARSSASVLPPPRRSAASPPPRAPGGPRPSPSVPSDPSSRRRPAPCPSSATRRRPSTTPRPLRGRPAGATAGGRPPRRRAPDPSGGSPRAPA